VECRIRKHDDRQFEVKVSYPLDRDRRRERYRLELFAFLPYQVGLGPATYSREEFYEDLRSYTRFKTPPLTLEALLNRSLTTNPLNRIDEMIRKGRNAGSWDRKRLLYETRMLGVMIRVQVRDAMRYIRSVLAKAGAPGAYEDAAGAISRTLDHLSAVLERMRGLGREFIGPEVPEQVARTWSLVDEFVSIEVESLLLRTLRLLDSRHGARPELGGARERLREAARAEVDYRATRGYPTVPSEDHRHNEYLLYRQSLLKKFCSSVLFLSVAERRGRSPLQHSLFALAAAFAMALGVLGLWLADRYYRGNAIALGLVAVIVYVIRDRLKEIVRDLGSSLLPRWVSDRKGKLVDPQTGRGVGVTRERLAWRDRAELPEDVLRARQYQDSLERAVSEPTDSILHYERDTAVHTAAIYRSHERSEAIDDILRVEITRWLRHMDNPLKTILALQPDRSDVLSLKAMRVYHVNLVVRLTARDRAETFLHRARLILTQRGIERLEWPETP